MACPNKITQSIINTCNPVKGVEPIIYWDYRNNLAFTFVDNTITAIVAAPLGRIEVKKFAINAGHEVVALENQANRFKHKLDAVINDANQVVDEMDDVVFFVKENASTTWKVYGAKYGCWKETQAAMINDNLGTIAVGFASREGMEEEYECYNTSIDIAALPNMESYDLIYGGTIANNGIYEFAITPKTLVGYVKLPNGEIKATVEETLVSIISGTSTLAGDITYYIPKAANYAAISGLTVVAGLSGSITSNFANQIFCNGTDLTTMTFAESDNVNVINAGSLANLIAPKATELYSSGCALTAKSIGDILYAAYVEDRQNVVYDFSLGTNAAASGIGGIDAYLQATYSVTFATVYASLDVTGSILYNL